MIFLIRGYRICEKKSDSSGWDSNPEPFDDKSAALPFELPDLYHSCISLILYTLSHHRAVEYIIFSMYISIYWRIYIHIHAEIYVTFIFRYIRNI